MDELSVFKKLVKQQKNEVKDEDILISPQFHALLTGMIAAMCNAWKKKGDGIEVKLLKNGSKTAWTDHKSVTINISAEIVKSLTLYHRAVAVIGLCVHEVGHILFTNSKKVVETMNNMVDNSYFACNCSDVNNYLVKASKDQRKQVAILFKRVQNVIEDGHIEYRIMRRFPHWGPYLMLLREIQLNDCISLAEMKQRGLKPKQCFFNLLLIYAKFGKELFSDAELGEEEVAALLAIEPLVDMAVEMNDSAERIQLIAECFNAIWRLLLSPERQNKHKQSSSEESDEEGEGSTSGESDEEGEGSSSGDNSLSEEEIAEMLSSLASALGVLGEEPEDGNPKGYSPASEDTGEDEEQSGGFTPESLEGKLSEMLNEIAEDMAMEEQEKQSIHAMDCLKKSLDFGNYHRGVVAKFTKERGNAAPTFDADMAEITPILRRLLSEFKKQIIDLQNGGRLNGLYFGRRLSQPYRSDFRRWSKNIAPEKIPDMSVCLYIDHSGSMYGEKIVAARRLAMLIYQFCKELGVDIAIYGHHAYAKNVSIIQYCDYGSCSNRTLAHISNIHEYNSCNRDGYGLRFCSEQLAKQPSEKKLLFVLSDGAPNDDNYDIRNATEDIHETLMKYAKKGVSYVAAGLLGDAPDIKAIYTENLSPRVAAKFLDISDLSVMPKKVTEIIKKAILS